MPSIDYAAVKELVSLSGVLEELGTTPVRRDRGGAHGRCPMCSSGSPRSDTLSWGRQVWYCHRCGRGGSVIDLYASSRGLTIYQAARALCDLAGVPVPYIARGAGRIRTGRSHRREEAP